MDMGSDSSSNTTNLPLSNPKCNSDSCHAFKAAHTASQAQISWASQFLYGHYTTWYYLVAIFLAMIVYGFRLLQHRRTIPKSSTGRTTLQSKFIAILRYASYRRVRGRYADTFGLPNMGMLVFVLFTCLYLLLLTFVQRPYYRGHRGYGSPPLAVRTGLMAIAFTPIIVALAGKVNFITMLTGISHEKLNVLHRYTSYMCLFLSIVHTVPFIVAPLKDGGAKQLRNQYYKPGSLEYTGTPPLGILVGLCLLSIPWLRSRFYTVFYRLHIPLYIVYLGTMFWHASQELDSWAYLWATLAVYLASIAGRAFYKWQTFNVFRPWLEGFSARLKVLDGGMTRADVTVPSDFKWKPGQHCWLRFTHLSVLHNHPFTIASIPTSLSGDGEKAAAQQTLRFYIRTFRGFTKALAASTDSVDPQKCTVHIDGPYGGMNFTPVDRYDELIFVAGGGGISACLPFMLLAANQISQKIALAKRIHLVWMVRESSHIQWVQSELEYVVQNVPKGTFFPHFFITDSSSGHSTSKLDADLSKDLEIRAVPAASPLEVGPVRYEKPFLLDRIPALLSGRRILIFGCGPESLKVDLSNAAARAQARVWSGDVDDIALHTETFGW